MTASDAEEQRTWTVNPKFVDMMHYIISKREEGLPKTVVAMLCYFSDFDHYEMHVRSISGEKYRKADHGPPASNFRNSLDRLVHLNLVEKHEFDSADGRDFRYKSVAEPHMDDFSEEELDIIDRTVERYGSLTSSRISELSHEDIPWMAAKMNEELDYETVFYRKSNTSVSEKGPDPRDSD